MDSEPRWLDIEDELYPEVVMTKQVVFENTINGHLTEFFEEITYNSFKREIDLTPLVFKYFFENSNLFNPHPSKNQNYELLIRDKIEEKLHFIGYFPQDNAYTLGENFLSEEILYFIVKEEQSNQEEHEFEQLKQEVEEKVSFENDEDLFDDQEEELNVGSTLTQFKSKQETEQSSKTKVNKRKTIEEILKIIAEWRKFIMVKKITPTEAADKVGMSKRSLEDYFTIIKLAEKYGFDFESKMKNAFSELRNFVKENHETRPAPKVQILEKFKKNSK